MSSFAQTNVQLMKNQKKQMNIFDRICRLLVGRPIKIYQEYSMVPIPKKKSVRFNEAKNQVIVFQQTEQMVNILDNLVQQKKDNIRRRQYRYIQKQTPPPPAGTILRTTSKSGMICVAIVQRDGSILEIQRGIEYHHCIQNRLVFRDLREWNYFSSCI